MAAEIEADRGVQARHALGGRELQRRSNLAHQPFSPEPGSEDADVFHVFGEQDAQDFAVLLVTVGHDDGGGFRACMSESGLEIPNRRCVGEALGARKVGAVVGHGDVPAEGGGELDQWLRIVAGAEEDERGRRDDEFDEVDAEVRGLPGAERFVRHGGDVRGRVSLEYGIAGVVEDEHGAGRILMVLLTMTDSVRSSSLRRRASRCCTAASPRSRRTMTVPPQPRP